MTQTMYAAVNTGPNQVEWRQLAKPRPGPGQVLIRTVACGICATDLEMIAGWERTGFPSIPGHEWSGVVEALGPGIEAGLLGCRCVAQNVWSDGGEVGFEHPGGYGQFFVTQASHVRVLPPSLPMHLAVLIEPLAVCIRGLTRARLKPQDHVLIVGDGTIGLLNLLLLKHDLGRRVAVVGGREHRLAAARALGADLALPHHAWPGPQALGF
jgi:threonine dehydrogenase-like Zn-dependent dehydrogenase